MVGRTLTTSAGLVAVALLSPLPAAATWPTDPTVNVPLCTLAGEQNGPQTVADGSGGAIVVWTDKRGGSSTTDIYAQRADGGGLQRWTTNGVPLCTATGDQGSIVAASDGAGGAIVAWADFRGASGDIYAQRVDASGAVLWAANGNPVCTSSGSQNFPTIVSDGAGGAIIAWADSRSGTPDIYVQRLDSSGSPQWTANGVALCTATGEQNNPLAASDGASGAIVAWVDVRTGNIDVYARRIDAAGTPLWTADGVPVMTGAGNQFVYGCVADGAGGAILSLLDAASHVYGQRLNGSGTALWMAGGLAVCTATGGQNVPRAIADGSGGAIYTWLDSRGADTDVYAQRISGAGSAQWTADGVAVCTGNGSQTFSPRIITDGASGAIIVWPDPRNGNQDLYAQRLNGSGTAQWAANGVPLTTASLNQGTQSLVPDGHNGATVAWVDLRNSNDFDIYAQRLLQDGTLGGEGPYLPASRPAGLALLGMGLMSMAVLSLVLTARRRAAGA